jgi:hypothetical protein
MHCSDQLLGFMPLLLLLLLLLLQVWCASCSCWPATHGLLHRYWLIQPGMWAQPHAVRCR